MSEKVITLPDRRGQPAPKQAVTPPNNPEYEQSVLGAVLVRPEVMAKVADILQPADFYWEAHGRIYQAMLDQYGRGDPVDRVTVSGLLKERGQLDGVGGVVFLAGLSEQVGFATNGEFYARKVKELADLRLFKTFGLKLAGAKTPGDAALICEQINQAKRTTGLTAKFVTGTELEAMNFPVPVWIIPGILGDGYVILAGRPKLGKSWLALCLAVAVATGGYALGKGERATQGTVLYLALEDRLRRIKNRLKKILGDTPFPEKLLLSESCERMDRGGLDELRKSLAANPDCRLLVIDTLAKVRPPRRKNIDPYEHDALVGGALQTLAHDSNTSILVVHHTRKGAADDPLDEVSGTTGITGAADSILILKRGRGKVDGTLSITGRDVEEQELALKFHPAEGLWELLGDASKYAKSQERIEIISIIQEHGPKTSKELSEIIGKNQNSVKGLLFKMAKDQELKSVGGRYEIIEK